MVNPRSLKFFAALLLTPVIIAGCSGSTGFALGSLGAGPGDISIVSATESTRLDASFRTAVYSFADENTADLYLTDLTFEQVETMLGGAGRSATVPQGAQILHIHLFLTPRAGRTPIEFSASNTTLTHFVLAGDEIGIYGGGGFLLPSRVFTREPGSDRFGGQMRQATLRFMNGTAQFDDRLVSASLDGTVNAKLDPDGAQRLATLTDALSRAAGRFEAR